MHFIRFRNFLILTIAGGFLFFSYACRKKNSTNEYVRQKWAWAVGNKDSTGYGMLLLTKDGGNTWQRQGKGSTALQGIDLLNVWAMDTNNVWIVGSKCSILRTVNGGAGWSRIMLEGSRPEIELQSISLAGNLDIWISGSFGRVYHTRDGGYNWLLFDTNFFHNGLMQGICAVNPSVVYVAGGITNSGTNMRGFIAWTRDGGQSWDSVVPQDNYNRNEWIGAKATDPMHVVVYGGRSHYIYTTNGGMSWKNDSIANSGGGDINCLAMLDAKTWWGALDYDGIFLTSNSGSEWRMQTSAGPQGMWLMGIDYYDRNQCIIVGESSSSIQGKILMTSDGGSTWTLKLVTPCWMNKVCFIKN